MVATTNTKCDYIRRLKGRTYTLFEACEIIETLDKFNTTDNCDIKWIDEKTGRQVYIGCCNTKKTTKKHISKKEKQEIHNKTTATKSKQSIKNMMRHQNKFNI